MAPVLHLRKYSSWTECYPDPYRDSSNILGLIIMIWEYILNSAALTNFLAHAIVVTVLYSILIRETRTDRKKKEEANKSSRKRSICIVETFGQSAETERYRVSLHGMAFCFFERFGARYLTAYLT